MKIVLAIFAFIVAAAFLGYSGMCAYLIFTAVDLSEVSLLEDGELQVGLAVTVISGIIGMLFAVGGTLLLAMKCRKSA